MGAWHLTPVSSALNQSGNAASQYLQWQWLVVGTTVCMPVGTLYGHPSSLHTCHGRTRGIPGSRCGFAGCINSELLDQHPHGVPEMESLVGQTPVQTGQAKVGRTQLGPFLVAPGPLTKPHNLQRGTKPCFSSTPLQDHKCAGWATLNLCHFQSFVPQGTPAAAGPLPA